MQVSELMMIFSAPLFWEGRPHFYARQLSAFLEELLDPDRPGIGALRPRARGEDWKTGQDAVDWVRTTLHGVWLPLADTLAGDSQAAFRAFNLFRADVFLDTERLTACLGEAVPPGTCAGLSVDWARPGPMLWSPQLRVSNYWPHNRDLAPVPPPGLVEPPGLDLDAAARVLQDDFYVGVRDRYLEVRYRYELFEATLTSGSQRYLSPAFYYAKPTVMPAQPEEFLSGSNRVGLERLSRVVLGTHDVLSADVSGAFLEGNLVTFRREVDHEQALQAFYLVVPWYPSDGEWAVEIETEFAFIADQLNFVELDAARAVNELYPELTGSLVLLGPWGATLDQAATLARELQRRVAFEPQRRGRKDTFELVRLLRSAVSRIQGAVLPATDTILLAQSRWQIAKENTIRLARQRITARPLPRVRSLLEVLAESGPYRANQPLVHAISQRAEQLREHLSSVTTALQDMLEQERREEQDHVEQNTRLLGYAVTILAAVTAFPILTGEMGWQDLRTEVAALPALGSLLDTLHPWLVVVSMILAGLAIVGLFVLMAYAVLPPLALRRTQLSRIGSKLARAYQLLDEAEPMQVMLSRVASVAVRDPRAAEPPAWVEMRKTLHARDVQAAGLVAEVMDWVDAARTTDAKGRSASASVENEVYRIIIASELFGNRPLPIPVPLTLALYRRTGAADALEFERLLNGYGFEDAEVEVAERLIEQASRLSRKEFLEVLQQEGVSALHPRLLAMPDGGDSSANGAGGSALDEAGPEDVLGHEHEEPLKEHEEPLKESVQGSSA